MLRFLVAILLVALPPLLALGAIAVFAGDWLAGHNVRPGMQLLIGAAVTVVWAGLVAIFASPFATGETRSMIQLVERGGAAPQTENQESLTAAQRRLTASLEERNRQIADLATMVHDTPIADDPQAVARSMAGVARMLTQDPTWLLVVVRAAGTETLPAGAYGADPAAPPDPVGEVHRWASTLASSEGPGQPARGARHANGPWGAFVIVDVAAGEELRAILMAPWEGRQLPSPAELGLLSLLGQHAATAIEHALLYTRLRVQTDELNRMAALQSDFLRSVTHDLQTPLTRIGALAAELRGDTRLDDAGRTDLDTIAHQAERLRRMVSQLLVVSRLEAGALTPRQEVFRVEPLVRRTWDALRADRTLYVTEEGEPHLAVGDPDRFEQVLWAILDNAVKYSPAGSPVAVQISGMADDDGGLHSVIEVRDEGNGMDHKTLRLAFDQFYRSDAARRLAPDGSGVGLYAARGLIEAMGGSVTAASRPDKGTTLTVSLPGEALGDGGGEDRS